MNLSFSRLSAAILGLCVLACSGCYSTRTRLPEHAKTVAVPVFTNKTYVSDYTRHLEVEATEQVRKAILQNGKLGIAGRETADLILEGQINRFDRRPIRVDRFGEPGEAQIVIEVTISLYDVRAARYLFQGRTVSNEQYKHLSGHYSLRRGEDETLARERAMEDLGRRILQEVVDY